jgi:RimJ/RimL family protein N-acetyltransferase
MIRGRRVALRPVEEDDYPLILRWQNHPEVWWYMDYDRPFSLADVREDMERSRTEGFPFLITVDGRPVGRIGLNQFHRRNRTCSLYLFIGEPEFWGRGYARDALMTLLTYAFDRLDLHLVHLWTLAANDRVIRVYERCGFVREAQLRDRSWKDGRFIDHVEMSVTRAELAKAREDWEREDASGR